MSEKNKNNSSNVEQMKEYQQAVSMAALQHLVSNLEKSKTCADILSDIEHFIL